MLTKGPKAPASEVDYLRVVTERVIEDIASADCRSRDGIMVSSSIRFLADDFDTLANDALVPPGVNAKRYISRATTLADFAEQAADEIDYGSESQGYARYAVVRKEAKPLLAMINQALGTRYEFTYLAKC